MRPRELAKALKIQRVETLLRDVGWEKYRSRFILRVDGTSPDLATGMKHGVYHSDKVNMCLIPSQVAQTLGVELGRAVNVVDPEPKPPPPPPPPSESGIGVVAVLAHVDHGKTTLLDALLGTHVTAHEAGGITQCVRPSLLPLVPASSSSEGGSGTRGSGDDGLHTLAFIDTPGHNVFVGMRAAAADGADLALILVASDAGVQPQTREVVKRCAELMQPVLFAITKADIAADSHAAAEQCAHIGALRTELRTLWEHELVRAGCSPSTARARADGSQGPVLSATMGWGLPDLLQTLRGQLCALEGGVGGDGAAAASEDDAVALVLEVMRSHGLGSTVLAAVRHGEMRQGSHFACGAASGRVRSLGVAMAESAPTDGRRTAPAADRAPEASGNHPTGRNPFRSDAHIFREVRSAGVGMVVRMAIKWDDFGGSFEVGDLLRVRPKKAAVALAEYRTMVARFEASRSPLEAWDAEHNAMLARKAERKAARTGGATKQQAAPTSDAKLARRAPAASMGQDEDEYYYYDEEEEVVEGEVALSYEGGAAAGAMSVAAGDDAGVSETTLQDLMEEARERREGLSSGAAAVIKTGSAGELQAMLDFLDGRKARRADAPERLVIASCGVGEPNKQDLLIIRDILKQKVPCALYALNLRVRPEIRKEALGSAIEIREYSVFHELLTDLLHSAGLPGPARELADMRDDGAPRAGDTKGKA